jgi:drug/metabolite transporter (DMT)-like permease
MTTVVPTPVPEMIAKSASLRPPPSAAKGIGWMLSAALAMTAMAILGREISREITTAHLMFWRGALSFVVMLGLAIVVRPGLRQVLTRRPGLHLARNTIHFAGQFGWFYALALIPLAPLFALEFMMPLWITLLAPLLIGERLTWSRFAAALIGFAGVVMVVRPSMETINAGTIAAFLCAIGFALSVISVRALTRTETPLRILFWMTGTQSLMALALIGGQVVVPSQTVLVWLAGIAVIGLFAQYAMARAFALAETLIVMPVDYLRLPLITAIGAYAYGEGVDPWILGGGALIILGNLANLWAERRARAKG